MARNVRIKQPTSCAADLFTCCFSFLLPFICSSLVALFGVSVMSGVETIPFSAIALGASISRKK